jgi:hypothetical protein
MKINNNNKNKLKKIENNQPSITVGSDVNTKEGNANLGNTTGDNADFSNRRKSMIEQKGDHSGATIGGTGTVNFTGGQNVLGGNNRDFTQNNNYNNTKSKLQGLEDEINNKIDKLYNTNEDKKKKLKILLWKIGDGIWEHVEKGTKWQRDWELNEKIEDLGNHLGDVGLIKSFCKEKVEEARLETKVEQSPK